MRQRTAPFQADLEEVGECNTQDCVVDAWGKATLISENWGGGNFLKSVWLQVYPRHLPYRCFLGFAGWFPGGFRHHACAN